MSKPSTPRKPLRTVSVTSLVLFSLFLAGRVLVLLNPNPKFPHSQVQNALIVVAALGTGVLFLVLGFGGMWLWTFRVSKRTDNISMANPDVLVVSIDSRVFNFKSALKALGVKRKFYRRHFFVLVASETGFALHSGYTPPKQATFVPWEDVVSIGRGEFTIGFKRFPMIELNLKTAGGSIYLPITITQPGRDPFHVGKPDLVVRTIDVLNGLRVSQNGIDTPTVGLAPS